MKTKVINVKIGRWILLTTILVLLIATAIWAQGPAGPFGPAGNYPKPDNATPPIIPGTEVKMLYSEIVDQEYAIQIALPYDYFASDQTYPVVYATLSDLRFGLTVDTVRELRLDEELRGIGQMPQVIVVGIGYDDPGWNENFHDEYPPLIFRDVTPVFQPGIPGSGEADNFLQFMEEELFPFIEANYRADPDDRTLIGHSVGGLFTLHALFQDPDVFQRYIALSPSSWWGDGVIFEYEEEYAETHSDLPVKLFLGVGALETDGTSADVEAMHQLLESRNYPSLEMEMVILEDETHSSVVPGATSRGFRSVFP